MSDAPVLRQGMAADAPAIQALTRAAYAKWVPLIGREPKPMTTDYEEAIKRHRFDLLHKNDALAALIETRLEPDHLLIVNVAVAPAFQGQGLGSKLLAHAETLAASVGQTRLYTHKLFTANVRLYRKLGYDVDREDAFMGGVAVYMSKCV